MVHGPLLLGNVRTTAAVCARPGSTRGASGPAARGHGTARAHVRPPGANPGRAQRRLPPRLPGPAVLVPEHRHRMCTLAVHWGWLDTVVANPNSPWLKGCFQCGDRPQLETVTGHQRCRFIGGRRLSVTPQGVCERPERHEDHTVISPRWTSARSYAGQFPTWYFVLYFRCTLDFMSRSCTCCRHDGREIDRFSPRARDPRTNTAGRMNLA